MKSRQLGNPVPPETCYLRPETCPAPLPQPHSPEYRGEGSLNSLQRLSPRFAGLAIWTICIFTAISASSNESLDQPMKPMADLLKQYCIDCHGAADPKAGLNLEQVIGNVSASDNLSKTRWEKVVKRLRSRQMPPADAERPAEPEYQAALVALESTLDLAAKAHPQPGRTDSIRRLNRTEYHNAIRDLLAMDVDVNAILPADESGHGFDNVTVGDLPPVLLNRYITAAERISRLAVGSSVHIPEGVNVRVPADRTQDSHVEGLPLGTRGGVVFDFQFPTTGIYEFQLRLTRDRDERLEGLSGSQDIDLLIDRQPLYRFNVSSKKRKAEATEDDYDAEEDSLEAKLKNRFQITAGPHNVGVTFPQQSTSLSEIKRQPFDVSFNRHRHPRRVPAIYEVSIVGPLDAVESIDNVGDATSLANETPSRRQIFISRPTKPNEERACADQIVRHLVRLAYRRPATDQDLIVPMRFFEQGVAAHGFEAGIESALSAILVSPYFLFRAESQPTDLPADSVYSISDLQLASRLSFFLWSSIPDDELLTLAERKRLREPEVLRQQVLRMLGDARSESLVNNFAAQWLYLRNLDSFRPDMRLYPDFDDNLRIALRKETEMLFHHILREDRSVLELIDTDTTFLNERLAKHYGIGGVVGSQFRAVKLTDPDSHRGGLLRHGSILAVTSYATRTSPTVRGHWILSNILGTPPPPPPPNVPSLKDKADTHALTIRERLAEHRANPTCASCHDLMDPVGFSLENFDAVGRWRTFDDGQRIDASGGLPDGTPIASFLELESSILKRPEMFVGTLTEKLMTFALGRGVEAYDGPAVRQIIRGAAEQEYRFSSLITGIVSSVPFQMRVVE